MQEDTKQNTKSFENKKLFTNETALQQSKSVNSEVVTQTVRSRVFIERKNPKSDIHHLRDLKPKEYLNKVNIRLLQHNRILFPQNLSDLPKTKIREINALDTFQKDHLYFKSGKYISEPVSKKLVSTITTYLINFIPKKAISHKTVNMNKTHTTGSY